MKTRFIYKKCWYAQYLILLISITFSVAVKAQDAVADNMLLYQRSIGGWPKHINEVKIDYEKALSTAEKESIKKAVDKKDATIDNSATTKEIRYLLKAFKQSGKEEYKKAAEKGIRFLLRMQYDNGGFPQYYPDSSGYRSQVTYNDNAMMNAMNILWDVANRSAEFILVDASLLKPSQEAIVKGIDCIVKTQIKVKGKLTAWCTQYDKKTLQPAKARAFELPAISASESVGIVSFLLKVEQPTQAVQTAIQSAVQWLKEARITGFRFVDVKDEKQPGGKDRVLVPDSTAAIWARFYDIETNKPFFTGRDGIKKWNISEIENERRIGYAWFGTWPVKLLEKEYPLWVKKNGTQDHAKN